MALPLRTNAPGEPSSACLLGTGSDDGVSRSRLIGAAFEWSEAEVVATAIAEASVTERSVYAEKLGNRYRWSLVHSGG